MEAIQNIAKQEAEKHADDIEAAVSGALRRVKRLSDYDDFATTLVAEAVRERVYDARHAMNTQLRRSNGAYAKPATVTAGKAVQAVATSLYGYMIDGRTLGSLVGEELDAIAGDQEAKANGYRFNAQLLRKLAPMVAEDKSVRQCVTEAKLKRLFRELL